MYNSKHWNGHTDAFAWANERTGLWLFQFEYVCVQTHIDTRFRVNGWIQCALFSNKTIFFSFVFFAVCVCALAFFPTLVWLLKDISHIKKERSIRILHRTHTHKMNDHLLFEFLDKEHNSKRERERMRKRKKRNKYKKSRNASSVVVC